SAAWAGIGSMATRQEFIAALPRIAVKTLKAIEFALAGQQCVVISYDALSHDYKIGRASVRYALRTLELVGLIEIGVGPYRCTRLELSNEWQKLGLDDVARLLPKARLPRPSRAGRKPSTSKPRRYVKSAPRHAEPEPEPVVYQTPSLPVLKFMAGWKE
ncbi:MAG: hypothetical protein WAO08_12420, partial [Hyphomicrobiaceae bacterium]